MSELKQKIKTLAGDYYADVVKLRRHLHSHPELSFQEYNTQKFVQQTLTGFGISNQQVMATTGVVALIEGRNPTSKTIALRGDMDALPIVETNEVEYKSQNMGVMHACGHDVHTSSLLGVARILNTLKNDFDGSVKLIFQPGEEKLPDGASIM